MEALEDAVDLLEDVVDLQVVEDVYVEEGKEVCYYYRIQQGLKIFLSINGGNLFSSLKKSYQYIEIGNWSSVI